jgi:hypothetical protein
MFLSFSPESLKNQMPYKIQHQHNPDYYPSELHHRDFVARLRHARQAGRAAF